MDRLEESLKRIMQVASVIGREFAFRILQSITDMRKDVKAHLLNLQGLEFIYEKRLFPELEYIFKHALTKRSPTTASSSPGERRSTGGSAKRSKSSMRTGWKSSTRCSPTTTPGEKTSRRPARTSPCRETRPPSAIPSGRPIASIKRPSPPSTGCPRPKSARSKRLDVLVLAVTPLQLLGFPEGSLGMLEEGEALAKELRDSRRLAIFYGRLSVYHNYRGNHLLGVRYSEDALEEGRKSEDVDLIVPVAHGLCLSYLRVGAI